MYFCTTKRLPDQLESLKTAIKQNPLNLPLNHITSQTDKFQLALQRGRLWKPGTVINVSITGGSYAVREKVVYYLKQWEEYAGITFKIIDSDGNIRVAITDSGSSWSYIGTDHLVISQNEDTMELGWLDDNTPDAEIRRVVLHEFGHALGCIHEHQNPVASIPWDKPKVYEYYARMGWDKATVDANLFETYEKDSTNYSDFDKESIMLYSIPEELTIGNYSVGWNSDLSKIDKQYIGTVYPKTIEQPTDLTYTLQPGTYYKAKISKPGEIDLYTFKLPITQKVLIETSGNTNVVMALLNEEKTKVLNHDDDGGKGRNAKIVAKVKADTTYFVAVKHFKTTGKGGYRIRLTALVL